MFTNIIMGKERSAICRAVIEIFKAWGRAYNGSEEIGDRGTGLIIGATVLIGEVEGKPMTATDIAAYTGIPRATVVRHLNRLRNLGYIIIEHTGNRAPVHLSNPNNPKVLAETRKLLVTLRKLAAEVTALDTEVVADHGRKRLATL